MQYKISGNDHHAFTLGNGDYADDLTHTRTDIRDEYISADNLEAAILKLVMRHGGELSENPSTDGHRHFTLHKATTRTYEAKKLKALLHRKRFGNLDKTIEEIPATWMLDEETDIWQINEIHQRNFHLVPNE